MVVRAASLKGLRVSDPSQLPGLVGTERLDPAYTSTRMGAWPGLRDAERPVVVRLRVPAGVKALALGQFTTAHHEAELLLPRGLTTRVVGVQRTLTTQAGFRTEEIWFVDEEVVAVTPGQLR